MDDRKYFKHTIVQLETIYEQSGTDCAILEELEEELENHRSTARAKKLLVEIQMKLNSSNLGASTHHQPSLSNLDIVSDSHNEKPEINWDSLIQEAPAEPEKVIAEKPMNNHPADILDTWTILEALSPQSYKKPNDLVIGAGSVAYLKAGGEPWIAGEKSRPKNNLYYVVYLGAVDLVKATEQLLHIYQDKRVERPAAKGLAALGARVTHQL